MPQFKVGDRVRVVSFSGDASFGLGTEGCYVAMGAIGTVVEEETDFDGPRVSFEIRTANGNERLWVHNSEIEYVDDLFNVRRP